MVYFSLIANDFQGLPAANEGLAYLETNSSTSNAYTFHYDNRDLNYNAQVFVPTASGIQYTTRSGNAATSFSSFDESSRNIQNIGEFEGMRANFIQSPNNQDFAMVDSQSQVWLYNLNTMKLSEIAVGNFQSDTVQLLTRSNSILLNGTINGTPTIEAISTSNPAQILFKSKGSSGIADATENYIAYATSSQIFVANLKSKFTQPTATRFDAIYSIRWEKSNALIVVALISGQPGLYRYDLSAGKTELIANLHLSNDQLTTKHIVCPVQDNMSRYYFADFSNGNYSIYRAERTAGSFITEVFASPANAQEGYTCPQIAN
jgi:hypothetical protein